MTEGSKRIVAQKAIKHGLSSSATHPETLLLRDEDREAILVLRSEFFITLLPTGAVQHALVERLVAASWRLIRIPMLEALQMEASHFTTDPDTGDTFDQGFFQSYLENKKECEKIQRHEAALQREFKWCFETLY